MDKTALVASDIEAGRKFTTFVKASGLPVAIAGWFRLSDEAVFKLYISTPDVEKFGPKAVYRFLEAALIRSGVKELDLDMIVAANTTNHFVNAVASVFKIEDSVVTLQNCVLNGVVVEHAVIYEMNRNVKPSRELPIFRTRHGRNVKLHAS